MNNMTRFHLLNDRKLDDLVPSSTLALLQIICCEPPKKEKEMEDTKHK